MVIKKDLVIAVLATFCVTATLFLIIPTRSSPNPYDPWLDVNDDGTINILDIATIAKAFGTTGDPTKNVNVTNWPWAEGNLAFNLNATNNTSITVPTGGFRSVTITIYASVNSPPDTPFQVFIGLITADTILDYHVYDAQAYFPFPPMPIPINPAPWYGVTPLTSPSLKQTYDVSFSKIMVWIWNNSTSRIWGNIYYYLTG
jgi:hypothetical protein